MGRYTLHGNGETLAQLLREAGISYNLPCGGRGVCGKCTVSASGKLDMPSAKESELLGERAGNGARLACCARAEGAVEIEIPEYDMLFAASPKGGIPAYDGGETAALGLAVDIGTTTVALELYDLPSGRLLASSCDMNRQGAFGADVLSRISRSGTHGHAEQHELIIKQISDMACGALRGAKYEPALVSRVVVTGNTTMLHYAAGLDPEGIGAAPFTPATLFGYETDSPFPELGGAKVYFPPCADAYVGADIICGLLYAGFDKDGGVRLFIDVGTNGEMALACGEKLLCCSAAAGPAFEGAHISTGMPASDGAIYRVDNEKGTAVCLTVGGASPRGICGTGLISAVRYMLESGALETTGALEVSPYELGDTGVSLTARDIREVQLAKAAIAAGIDTLLYECGIPPARISGLILAGGFGGGIDPRDAEGIGLIPFGTAAKTRTCGNSALKGAVHMLFSLERRRAAEALARRAVPVKLSGNPVFERLYVERMMFPGEE